MEHKASAFVAAFGATLFAQWAEEPRMHEDLFWADAAALQRTLEDGIAKLPQPKLQAALSRDLARFLTELQTLLQEKHRDYELQQHKKKKKTSSETQAVCVALLNEDDVERALAPETDAAVASVLAREDVLHAVRLQQAATAASTAAELVAIAGECAERLRVVRARRFESASERDGVAAFYWTLIHTCAAGAMQRWCGSRGVWCVSASTASERETLRRVLRSLVAADALVQSPQEPWSTFFRPAPHKMFRSLDFVQARASVYGALLSLAVSFPVVYDDDNDEEDATSDSSSSDSDSDSDIDSPANRHAAELKKQQQRNKRDHQECGTLAAHVVRQIVLSAKRENDEGEWYLAVLKAFHTLAKPTQFVTDDDEDEEALTRHQQATLHDARAELYARAFASSPSLWTSLQQNPLAVLETLLCLRHASEFLRVERKQTIAPVATATSQLAGVPLPSAFWQWLANVKKVFAGQEPVVQRVMKTLAKHKTSDQKTKMANVLMHDSVVTLSELRVVVEQFALYLEMEKERSHFVVARGGGGEAPEVDDEDAPDQALFFQDHDGGRSKKRTQVEEGEEVVTKRGRTNA